MGAKTGIEWTDATWNPIIGCSRVSEGCRNCYAESIAGRFGAGKETVYSGLTQIVNGRAVWTGQIKETRQLLQPLSWKQPKRIFVNSMSDLFHENVTDEMRDRIFAVMALCPQHTFQVLTKRPERMLAYIKSHQRSTCTSTSGALARVMLEIGGRALPDGFNWPLPNVWLGVSVENQAAADERIPLLLKTPAAIRFISAEPLLGPVSLRWKDSTCFGNTHPRHKFPALDAEGRVITDEYDGLRELDWVICGGESGPGARPMHTDWARSLRDQCAAAGVPFFFKQWGEWLPALQDGPLQTLPGGARTQVLNCSDAPVRVGKKTAGALLDGREWKQFPAVQ